MSLSSRSGRPSSLPSNAAAPSDTSSCDQIPSSSVTRARRESFFDAQRLDRLQLGVEQVVPVERCARGERAPDLMVGRVELILVHLVDAGRVPAVAAMEQDRALRHDAGPETLDVRHPAPDGVAVRPAVVGEVRVPALRVLPREASSTGRIHASQPMP